MEEIRKERRKFPRIPIELIVRYKILSTPEKQLDATTKNISGGGVCLITRERMEPGTVVAMEMNSSHLKQPILTTGQTIWSNKSSLGPSPAGHMRFDNGIEFMQINDVDRQQIIKHVESELKKEKTEGWKIGIVKDLAK